MKKLPSYNETVHQMQVQNPNLTQYQCVKLLNKWVKKFGMLAVKKSMTSGVLL